MNKDWASQNKRIQTLLCRETTFQAGVAALQNLRRQLADTLQDMRSQLRREEFDLMPFVNAPGYHSKNIAYSLWHIARIEDIVAHTLVADDEQVFFREGYQQRMNAPIITTGNELKEEEIAAFTVVLNLDELYQYVSEVRGETDSLLASLPYAALKDGVPAERKERLHALQVVSDDADASWLADYWCGKDVRGLILMPFSRHWIMHTEAALRINAGVLKRRKA